MTVEPKSSSSDAPLVVIGAFVLGGLALIALLYPNGRAPGVEAVRFGLLLGTITGEISLAAAWSALGPGTALLRFTLASTWLVAVIVATGANIAGTGARLDELVFVGSAMVVQWITVQATLRLIVVFWRAFARSREAVNIKDGFRARQFGIRQLMLLTAVVAAVLGVGRLMFPQFEWAILYKRHDTITWTLFAITNVFIAAPLILMVVLRSRVAITAAGSTGIWISVSLVENSILSDRFGAWQMADGLAWCTNAVQCLWIMGILWLLHSAGYSFDLRNGNQVR